LRRLVLTFDKKITEGNVRLAFGDLVVAEELLLLGARTHPTRSRRWLRNRSGHRDAYIFICLTSNNVYIFLGHDGVRFKGGM
jgi:hypothetical protein